MLPFQLAHYSAVPQWEGKVPWLYLDSHKPNPLPTAGIGCEVEGLAESLTLGWTIAGRAATPDEITADWHRVTALPGARLAHFYQAPGCPLLPESAIAALVAKRYNAFTPELDELFPEFSAWPVTAQTGALDLIWCVGAGDLRDFTHFLAAARARDWRTAAAQCAVDVNLTAFDARNTWRAGLFLQALAAA